MTETQFAAVIEALQLIGNLITIGFIVVMFQLMIVVLILNRRLH